MSTEKLYTFEYVTLLQSFDKMVDVIAPVMSQNKTIYDEIKVPLLNNLIEIQKLLSLCMMQQASVKETSNDEESHSSRRKDIKTQYTFT